MNARRLKRLGVLAWVSLALAGTQIQAGTMAHIQPGTLQICREENLKGTFVLAGFTEEPEGDLTRRNKDFPYHYLTFRPAGQYELLTSPRGFETPAKLNPILNALLSESVKKKLPDAYRLSNDGWLTLYKGAYQIYQAHCVVSLKTGDGYKKNDLILSYSTKNNASKVTETYQLWY